jgi:polar amino acid transport system permease protein
VSEPPGSPDSGPETRSDTGSHTGSGSRSAAPVARGERAALASARIPFRLKVAAVWVGIFLFLGFFGAAAGFDLEWIRDKFTFILGGLRYTLLIAVGGIVIAVVLATLGALARIGRNPVTYGIAGFYVSFFRGTPLIVQMYLIYLALPPVGRNLAEQYAWLPDGFDRALVLDAALAGTVALGLNYGAYMTEIFRAGVLSVAGGQGEAADALGMTYAQKMRKVVLPQAFRVIIPPTGNEFIAMLKDTALVSFLGVTAASAEIFRRAQLVGKADFKNLEAYIAVALIYWGLTVLFTFFQARLEARIGRGYDRSQVAKAGHPHAATPKPPRTKGLGR